MKKYILLPVLTGILSVVLSACNSDAKNAKNTPNDISGKYEHEFFPGNFYEFKSDGTFTNEYENKEMNYVVTSVGDWEVKEDSLFFYNDPEKVSYDLKEDVSEETKDYIEQLVKAGAEGVSQKQGYRIVKMDNSVIQLEKSGITFSLKRVD